jgi:hypothetical protein
MRTPIACCLAATIAILVPAGAGALPDVGERRNGLSKCDERYLIHHANVVEKKGAETAGRNLVAYGLLGDRKEPEPIGEARSCSEAEQLHLILHPPEPEPIVSESGNYAPAPPSTSTGGSGCIGMEAESGPLGYSNFTNPDYAGCYQISYEHYEAGGICEGMGLSPGEQDACAGRICDVQGSGAWRNPDGANPCGRL